MDGWLSKQITELGPEMRNSMESKRREQKMEDEAVIIIMLEAEKKERRID